MVWVCATERKDVVSGIGVLNAKAVTVMGDSIIFMGGIAVGSLITMFICMIAIISDDIRRESKREFRQEDEDY